MIAPVDIRGEHLFSEFSVLGVLQEGPEAGSVQREHPFALETCLGGSRSSGSSHRFGEACKLGGVVDHQPEGVHFF